MSVGPLSKGGASAARGSRLRFALQSPGAPDGATWAAAARRAEEQGFDAISMPDHLGGQLSPLPALAAAAAVTSRIQLTTFVLANDLRNPALLARDIATIDALSGGRTELGIGAGWSAYEYAQLGVAFDQPSVRIARLGEAIDILERAFTGETFSFTGHFYELTEFSLGIPVGRPHIPLILGGGGRKMLTLAATRADIVSITTNNATRTGPGQLARQYAWDVVAEQVSLVREAAGDRWGELQLNVRVLELDGTNDRSSALAVMGARLGVDPAHLDGSPFVFVGRPAEIADHIQHIRTELGISYFTISARHADAFRPVLARVHEAGF